MKTLFATAALTIGLLALVPSLPAQQVPLVTGFGFQTQLANPAEKGTHDSPVTLWFRKQWASFGEDSPTTFNLDADLSGLLGLQEKRIGLGLRLISDRAHIVKRNNVNLDFAYHLVNTGYFFLSAGVSAGFLNQRMDFGEPRLNDPADLTLFEAAESRMRFDGGPSLFARVGDPEGSFWKAGVALPQLFTSDLDYGEGRIFGLQPHLLAYAGYMWQTASVAVEPVVMARMMFGDYDCKCANVDVMLRGHFLDGLFWVGGGYRLGGSVSGGFGVNLLERKIQINALVESLSEYGLSYEGGVTYAFGGEPSAGPSAGPAPKMPLEVRETLARYSSESAGIVLESRYLQQSVDQALLAASAKLNDAKKQTAREQTREDLFRSSEYLARASQDLDLLLEKTAQLEQMNDVANRIAQTYRQARNREILEIRRNYQALDAPVAGLAARKRSLKEDIDAFTVSRGLDLIDIGNDDPALVQGYLQHSLDKLASKPQGMPPVRVTSLGAFVEIEYRFPYLEPGYNPAKDAKLAGVKSLMDHVAGFLSDMGKRGIAIHSVMVRGNLQKGLGDLTAGSGVKYNGDYGYQPRLEFFFLDPATGKDTARSKPLVVDKEMNNEELSALRMFALKEYLDQRELLPREQVRYGLYGPVTAAASFLETALVIRLKK